MVASTLPFPSKSHWRRSTRRVAGDVTPAATGVYRSVVVPSPTWPAQFSPQHQNVPVGSAAQECAPPAPTDRAPESPLTCTGVYRSVVVPSPSCPAQFPPQHRTVSSLRTAQV